MNASVSLGSILVIFFVFCCTGGQAEPYSTNLDIWFSDLSGSAPTNLTEANEALDALARQSQRAMQVVELKFFGGLTGEEIAQQLVVSLATVNNDWKFAKAWLYRELGADAEN